MLKAIITAVLLGTSTMAIADTPSPDTPYPNAPYPNAPYPDRPNGYTAHPEQFDWRTNFRGRRVVLAQDVRLDNRIQRPTWVPINARRGVSRLRLQLQTGNAFIDNVTIVFMDGHREVMPVRRLISWRDPSITLDLTHGGVSGIFIDSSPMPGRYARGGGYRRNQFAVIDVIGLRR